ncbi:MAG: ABC transporter ATP-binding protein [Planctomycetes bacterium]|nr:ABC transporter ATP-binding protein [Planctomycetota bacterium]
MSNDLTIQDIERPMWRLFAYLRPMRGRLGASVSASVANKVLDLAPPILVAWLIDSVTGHTPHWIKAGLGLGTTMSQIVFLAILTVVIFGLESLTQWGYGFGFQNVAQDLQHSLRLDAYSRMQDREIRFFEEHRLGKTLAMLNDDVNQLERFFNQAFNDLVQLCVLFLFAGTVLFTISPSLAAVGLIPVPIIIFGSLRFSKLLEPRYKKVREGVGEVASRLENNIGGILVIKSFTAEKYETERVSEASEHYRAANRNAIKLSTIFVPVIRMAIALGFGAVIVLGGYWVTRGQLSAGELVLFCMMIQRMLWPLTRLGNTFDEYQRARASAVRIFGLLDTPSRVQDPAQPQPLERAEGAVEFEDVFFKYRDREPVLNGLSLHVKPGEMIGIAGTTGAGKSTLIKLLLRLYDVNEGAIRIDGIDIRKLAQHDLRRQIALVSQDVFLFHGTIRENIAYPGVDVTDEQVIEASRHAQFHDFVESLPDGYETVVGERGIKLSGGQRQRLSIARALLKNAPILVLDEATSSVDTETERMIQQNLEELTSGRTALVIAHRLSTIRKADRIIVLKDGRVEEEGHHDDLIAKGGTYADLWAVQSGAIESPVK